MATTLKAEADQPTWEIVANRLDHDAARPTPAQVDFACRIGLNLREDIPAYVAAVVLRRALGDVLFENSSRGSAEIPKMLRRIEKDLGIKKRDRARLVTGTREEVSAWFAARYAVKTSRGLRSLRPEPGDIVLMHGRPGERRIISSIGDDGRVYMKGRPPRRAWPNHLDLDHRMGDTGYEQAAREVDASLRNAATYTETNFVKLEPLREYALVSHIPSSEALRALEELLDSGERLEEPFQELLTEHPALLAAVATIGGWKTYVLPKQRLGSEYVPDFLVLGINSLGPQWVAVELEAPRHKILIKDGSASNATRHGIKQIRDWREWLTSNVAYAHNELHLYGLTNLVPGLVIIGRDDPKTDRVPSRAQSEEESRLAIHSWDWVLRHAQLLASDSRHRTDFAVAQARSGGDDATDLGGYGERQGSVASDDVQEQDFYELDLDDLL